MSLKQVSDKKSSIEARAFERMHDDLYEKMIAVQRKQDPSGIPMELSEFSDHSLLKIVKGIMGTGEDKYVHNALIKHLVNNRYDILQDAKITKIEYDES